MRNAIDNLWKRIVPVLALLLVSFVLDAPAAQAQFGTWPLSSSYNYVPQQIDWGAVRDYTGDQSPSNADISSGGIFQSINIGLDNSVYTFSDGTNLFFRFLLSSNPLSWNNSLKTYQIDSRSSFVVMIDSNNDNVQDFVVTVSKSNAIHVYPGTSSTPIRNVPFGTILPTGDPPVYTDSTGFIRVIDTGIGVADKGQPGAPADNMHILDAQVPLSWLPGFTPTTFFRPYFGTSNNDNNINKDLMIAGATAVDFNSVASVSAGDTSVYGALYDTRDTAPSSSGGTWTPGETLQITGYGWPSNAAIPIRIVAPDGVTQVYSGTLTANSTGNIVATNSWAIPQNSGGIYRILVGYPNTSSYRQYDTFTVNGPLLTVTKTPDKTTAAAGDFIDYTITYGNAGTTSASNVMLTDAIPANTTFVSAAGSNVTIAYLDASGGTVVDPAANPGSVATVTWTRSTLAANTTGQTVTLRVKVNAGVGGVTITNTVSTSATGITTGPTATATTVIPGFPLMQATKAVDKTSALPGEVVTYTLTYKNAGTAPAYDLELLDAIPANSAYVTGSASGTGTTITYQHVANGPFDTSDAAPVLAVKWTLSAPVAVNATGTVTFKVTVQ